MATNPRKRTVPPAEGDGDQRTRIIDSAITLFTSRGMDAVGLRELTAHAGVNLAAVNYYFGSKDDLAETVFAELSKRVNSRRLKTLCALQETASTGGAKPGVREVLEAFIEPYLGSGPNAEEGKLMAQFILKHRLAPTAMTHRVIRKHFDPMAKAFIDALCQAEPGIKRSEFVWRYMFSVSAVVLTVSDQSGPNRFARLSGDAAEVNRKDELKEAFLRFATGAMTAKS